MPRFGKSKILSRPQEVDFQPRINWKQVKRILLIRDGGLGDVLMCTPVLESLSVFRNLPIYFATNPKYFELLNGNFKLLNTKDVSKYSSSDTAIFDLRGQLENFQVPRNRLHRIDSIAEFCGIPLIDHKIRPPELKSESWTNNWLKEKGYSGQILIGLAPRAQFRLRSWVETYPQKLLNLLPAHCSFILFGENNWYNFYHPRVYLATFLTLTEIASLIQKCDFLISTDNGLLHLAGALDIPAIAFFGSIPPEIRIKYYSRVFPLVPAGISCVPCFDWQEKETSDRDYCINTDTKCMRALTPEIVAQKIVEFFGERFNSPPHQ